MFERPVVSEELKHTHRQTKLRFIEQKLFVRNYRLFLPQFPFADSFPMLPASLNMQCPVNTATLKILMAPTDLFLKSTTHFQLFHYWFPAKVARYFNRYDN